MDGIININKEPGFTSFDVVAKLRGILKQKKIGHTGTLDPDARGVLPVCVGKATKVCEYLTDHDKEYEAVLHLGIDTDTQDMSGNVLKQMEVNLAEDEIRKIIQGFVGEIEQVPPMYSAIKVNGQKLYDLARKGIEVERKPRKITIFSIEILEIKLPLVKMSVHCSKGTYIRTLCHDIGALAGCGGCMEQLLRTRTGSFSLDSALTLGEVEAIAKGRDEQGRKMEDILLPLEDVFVEFRKVFGKKEADRLLINGNPISLDLLEPGGFEPGESVRMYSESGRFIGLFTYDSRTGRFRPKKMFL
ncbi:MAG: tRNA pseudouridine(55) synthase TruB [Roseburia sp.]|nr:tRNA pseudouridine(55) synthase TruB [Roseburia sp.]